MLIGLMSDSHDNMPLIRKAVDYFNSNGVSLVLHAGDFISPICAKELKNLKCKMIGVFGNNDGEKNFWRQKVNGWGEIYDESYEGLIEGLKVLLMHEPRHLDALISSQMYDVIVYGHTHVADHRVIGKTLVVNPGECGGWLTGRSTAAMLRLPEKEVIGVTL